MVVTHRKEGLQKVGLLLRLTSKEDPFANRPVRRKMISPVDILNKHLVFLDDGRKVWFSHSQIRPRKEIRRLIVFSNKNGEFFVYELFFDDYIQYNTPQIPPAVKKCPGSTPPEWAAVPELVWVHLTGYQELTLKDAAQIHMCTSGDTLDKQIERKRFTSAEFFL